MNVETEAMKGECVEEDKGLCGQVVVLNRELEFIKGLLTDRFLDLNPTLNNPSAVLNDQAGGRRSTKRDVGNDEMDALCMQLYFRTLPLCLDKHNVQTHRSHRHRSPLQYCSLHTHKTT
jgi:hypothetical protein